jgi:hypothetical protein
MLDKWIKCNNKIRYNKYKFICYICIENEKPLYINTKFKLYSYNYNKKIQLYIKINGKFLYPNKLFI